MLCYLSNINTSRVLHELLTCFSLSALFVVQQHKKQNCRKLRDTHKCAVSGHCSTKQTLHTFRISLGTGSAGRMKSHKAHSEIVQCPKTTTQEPRGFTTASGLVCIWIPHQCQKNVSVMEKAQPGGKIKREQRGEQKHL